MAFNMYGAQNIAEPMEEAVGLFSSKLKSGMKDFFGISRQSEMAMARKQKITGDVLRGAIRNFGMKNLMGGGRFYDDALKKMTEELKTITLEATRARKVNDMNAYQAASRRRVLVEQMRASVQMAKEAKVGQIFTAVAMAIAQLLGIGTARWQNADSTSSAGYTPPSYSYDPDNVPMMG